MKRMMMIMAALLVMGSLQQLNAQQRRSTTQSTVQRQNVQQPVVTEVASYLIEHGIQDMTVTQDYIYYIEKDDNNAVKRIDRKTGDVETVVEGQGHIYEGRRPHYQAIDFAGGKTIYTYGPYSTVRHVGIVIDGKLKTFKDSWADVYATNGKYALVGNLGVFDCINLENMNFLFQGLEGNYGTPYILQPNGDIWWPKVDGDVIGVRFRSAGVRHEFYSLADQPYIANEHVREISQMRAMGDYIYVACKRRIYAMNINNPGQWIEYAKVPPTMDYSFTNFWVNPRGDILGTDDMIMNGRVQLFRAEALDKPESLGRGLYIDTKMRELGFEHVSLFQTKVVADADNNWVVIDGRAIKIYNPNGVVGYEKARGKVIKL